MPTRPRAFSYVRMSTDVQLKGDSLRRQLEQSREYAAQQGWDLLEEDQLRDIGVSAFSGANVSGGALGQFLEAVRNRRVEPGSFLIVESLDRLSRQEVLKSLGVFIEIVNSGVNIVTLADGRTYTAATGFEDLIFSIVSMSRAHDESRTKSIRLSAAWSNKRKNAETRKLTAQCPGWLKLSNDKKQFEVIQKRADIVVSIFQDSTAGVGNYSITRRLNQTHVPPFGRSRGWRSSSVNKILANRAVLGEFQPHRLVDGRRVPDGDAIKDYFPAIIDEQLFYRAQNARDQRRVKGAGRKGPNVSNLFSGLATCAYCGSKMRFENKGPGPKGGTYLVCDSARRGLRCEKTAWRYDAFERSFLAFVKEVDLERLVYREDEARKRSSIDDAIAALRGEQAAIGQQMDRTYELLGMAGTAAGYVAQKLQTLEDRRSAVEAELREREQERARLGLTVSDGKQVKALIERLQDRNPSDEAYKLRSTIAARLRSLVTTILIAPLGHAPLTERTINFLAGEVGAEPVIDHLRRTSDGRRYFAVGFTDGKTRAVFPHRDDPLSFEYQIVGDTEGIRGLEPSDDA
jgi:DNA invertase Pin-like site-specific DNA recombinase